jgi:sugar/nucleoside kinase (ribokinase family)
LTSDLVAFGNLCIDDLVFADGSTRWNIPGGNAMYAALGMAVWAERVAVVAPVGAEYPQEWLQGRIDLSRCPHVPKTLRNWGLYEDDGSRHFIFRTETRHWESFCPTAEAAASSRQAAAHVAPMPHERALAILQTLRNNGTATLSLDLDERDLHGMGLETVDTLMGACDLFMPSRQEARVLFPSATPVDALRRLRELNPDTPLVVIKCSADGVIGHEAGASTYFHVPAVPVELVDATGGGDSFCGGLIARFAASRSAVEAMISGVVSASFCVEGLGLTGLATASPVEALERFSLIRDRVCTHSI